ncbi:MAG: hypothetical protein JWR16_1377 [Nevskia sp.]|nr:hypothetical protein [Nevskia sp.]
MMTDCEDPNRCAIDDAEQYRIREPAHQATANVTFHFGVPKWMLGDTCDG